MNVELSIIIVNYNTFDLTLQCIASVVKETNEIDYEIIVVDNASTEKPIDEIKNSYPSIQLIKNSINVGFGIANNMGMQAAKGNYVLLLNSDTIIIEQGITKAYQYIKQHPNVDVLTCKQLNEDRKPFVPFTFYFKTNSILSYLINNPIQQLIKSKLSKSKPTELNKNSFVKSLSGAFMLLKKEVFATTRGFDPDFFIYYEETEWCMRINKNYKQYYLNDISFIHLHGKSAPRLLMQKQMHLSQGLFWYKSGYINYFLFLLITYLIYLPSWVLLAEIAIKPSSRNHFLKYVKIYLSLSSLFFTEILKYKNGFGKRIVSLKISELSNV